MVSGVLLAAGFARRFGADKLTARLPDGRTLFAHSLARLQAALPHVVVVIRPDSGLVIPESEELQVVVCADAVMGMGKSLASGVAVAPAGGLLVALADMPFIAVQTVRAVADAIEQGADLAAPFYHGQRGHPVGFHARHRARLLALADDRGAKDLLTDHADALERIDVPDPGILQDIDTPADFSR